MYKCEECGKETSNIVGRDFPSETSKQPGDWGYWLTQPFKMCKDCFNSKANVSFEIDGPAYVIGDFKSDHKIDTESLLDVDYILLKQINQVSAEIDNNIGKDIDYVSSLYKILIDIAYIIKR